MIVVVLHKTKTTIYIYIYIYICVVRGGVNSMFLLNVNVLFDVIVCEIIVRFRYETIMDFRGFDSNII